MRAGCEACLQVVEFGEQHAQPTDRVVGIRDLDRVDRLAVGKCGNRKQRRSQAGGPDRAGTFDDEDRRRRNLPREQMFDEPLRPLLLAHGRFVTDDAG